MQTVKSMELYEAREEQVKDILGIRNLWETIHSASKSSYKETLLGLSEISQKLEKVAEREPCAKGLLELELGADINKDYKNLSIWLSTFFPAYENEKKAFVSAYSRIYEKSLKRNAYDWEFIDSKEKESEALYILSGGAFGKEFMQYSSGLNALKDAEQKILEDYLNAENVTHIKKIKETIAGFKANYSAISKFITKTPVHILFPTLMTLEKELDLWDFNSLGDLSTIKREINSRTKKIQSICENYLKVFDDRRLEKMSEDTNTYDKFNSVFLKKSIDDYKTAVNKLNALVKNERISLDREIRNCDKTKIEKLAGKVKYLTSLAKNGDDEEIYPKPVEFSSVMQSSDNKNNKTINFRTFPYIVKDIAVKPDSLFLGKIKQRIVSDSREYNNPSDRFLSIIDLFETNPILTHNDKAYISRLGKAFVGLAQTFEMETPKEIEQLKKAITLRKLINIIQTLESYMDSPSYTSEVAVS